MATQQEQIDRLTMLISTLTALLHKKGIFTIDEYKETLESIEQFN